MSRLLVPVVFMLLASLLNATAGVCIKYLNGTLSTITITFFSFFLGLFILSPWFARDKQLFDVSHLGAYFLRSLTTLVAMLSIFFSYHLIPLANAVVLNTTYPLFLPILVFLFLRVRTSLKVWLSIIVGFIGVVLVLQPDPKSFNVYSLIALASGLFAALSAFQIKLMTKKDSPQKILFWLYLICTCLTFLMLLDKPEFHVDQMKHLGVAGFGLLFAVGLCRALYQLFITLALKMAPARYISPIAFSQILFGAFYGSILFGESMDVLTLIGICVTTIGGVLTIVLSSSGNKQQVFQSEAGVTHHTVCSNQTVAREG